MVQWLTREHTYTHPWERVTLAFWRKYPNPLSPHVKEIDILNRFIGLLVFKLFEQVVLII